MSKQEVVAVGAIIVGAIIVGAITAASYEASTVSEFTHNVVIYAQGVVLGGIAYAMWIVFSNAR